MNLTANRYPLYRSSNVEWLGVVPAHWIVCALGKVSPERCDGPFGSGLKSSHYTEFGVRVVRLSNIKSNGYVWDSDVFIDSDYYEQHLRDHSVKQGDVLVAGLGDANNDVGRACVAPAGIEPAMVKADCFRFRTDPRQVVSKFIAYQLSISAKYCAGVLANGSTRSRIPLGSMLTRSVAYGPLEEQVQVARFLDYETARIDALIEKQQQLIALLKEKRQAVISHAVTKGLNPDAPLRDSGVEWLGMVPAHWEVARLKQVTHGATSGPYGSSLTKAMYTRAGIRVYGQQQVIAADFSLGDYYISEAKFSEMTRYEVFPDDVLVTVMGTIGRVAVVPEGIERGIINPRLVRYKGDRRRILPKFLRMSILGDLSQARLKLMSQGSTMEGINMQILGNLPVALPPLTEQEAILARLECNAVKLERLVENVDRTVELLQERRTALISAAVTGKIDVRNWAPPESKMEQDVA